MSDFVGMLVAGGQALHLVDWDRPVWVQPGDLQGLRITPGAEHFVADALAVFAHAALESCTDECARGPLRSHQDLETNSCQHLEDARRRAYSATGPAVLFLHAGSEPDAPVAQDLARLAAPHATVAVGQDAAQALGLS